MTLEEICKSQKSFNNAFHKAVKYNRKKEDKENRKNKKLQLALLIYFIIHAIFLIWAIILAYNSPHKYKVVDLTLAIVFSPVYVFAYYLNILGQ